MDPLPVRAVPSAVHFRRLCRTLLHFPEVGYRGGDDRDLLQPRILPRREKFRMFREVPGVDVSCDERLRVHKLAVERNRRADTVNPVLVESPAHAGDGLLPVGGPDHQLGQHRVVEDRNLVPRIGAAVVAHAGTLGEDANLLWSQVTA